MTLTTYKFEIIIGAVAIGESESIPYREIPKTSGQIVFHACLRDIVGHPSADGPKKRFDLLGLSFRHEFHLAVGKVAHEPGYGEPFRQAFGRVAEPNALDA